MVERQPSKLNTWVRFPSPAPTSTERWDVGRRKKWNEVILGPFGCDSHHPLHSSVRKIAQAIFSLMRQLRKFVFDKFLALNDEKVVVKNESRPISDFV